MQNLWAPWRMEFIDGVRESRGICVFCEAALPGDDKKNLVLHRGERAFVLMNRYPYNNGHLMILPYKHTGVLSDLSSEDYVEILHLSALSMNVMTKQLGPDGFNCGFNFGRAAGAGITDHLHFHVVPRWSGDTNFMPVLAETRSMPEHLATTYEKLVGHFKDPS